MQRRISIVFLLATGATSPAYADLLTSDPHAPTPPAQLAPASAPAELALGDMQLLLEPRRELLATDSPDPLYRLAAFAQVTAGGPGGGDLGVGAAGAVSGLGCDVVAGSAQARVQLLGSGHAEGASTGTLCLSRIGITAVFDGRNDLAIAPAIDARRSLWSRPYDQTYQRMTIGLGELRSSGASRHSLFMMSLGHGTTTQTDGDDRRRIVDLDLDFVLYRLRHVTTRGDTVVDALVITNDSIKAGDSDAGGVTTAVLPVRAQRTTDHDFLQAQAGVGFTGGTVHASTATEVNGQTTSEWSDTVDGTGLPAITALVGSATAGVTRHHYQAALTVARSFYPTFDGDLALEDRFAGSISSSDRALRGVSLTVSPFVTHTTSWTRDAGVEASTGYGASMRASYPLTRRLRMDAIGQAGRTPYARLDGSRLADNLGAQLLVGLSARVAR